MTVDCQSYRCNLLAHDLLSLLLANAGADSSLQEEGKKQPKRGAKAASRAKPAVTKASDSEEEEEHKPKRAAKVAKGDKSAGRKGTSDKKEKQQQPKKAVKPAAKSKAATSRGKTKSAATNAADSASEDTDL